MKHHNPIRVCTHVMGHLQSTHRGGVAINLAVTFIRENSEIMFLGQGDQITPIGLSGNRTLRVCRRTKIGNGHAIKKGRRQRGIIRQIARFSGCRHIDWLCINREACHRINLIKRVWHQNSGFLPRLFLNPKRKSRIEQPLTRAVQGEDMLVCVKVNTVAARDPSHNRRAQIFAPLIGGVTAKTLKRLRNRASDELRERMTRLTDRHVNRIAARLMDVKQFPQTRKGVFWQVRKPLGKHHDCLKYRGLFSPL